MSKHPLMMTRSQKMELVYDLNLERLPKRLRGVVAVVKRKGRIPNQKTEDCLTRVLTLLYVRSDFKAMLRAG